MTSTVQIVRRINSHDDVVGRTHLTSLSAHEARTKVAQRITKFARQQLTTNNPLSSTLFFETKLHLTMAPIKSLAVLAMTISGSSAFAPTFGMPRRHRLALHVLSEPQQVTSESPVEISSTPLQMQHNEGTPILDHVQAAIPKPHPKKEKEDGHGKQGIFSPLVVTLKKTMGEEELNRLRAKVISMHSEVIASFVSTAETPFGQKALEVLFQWADKNQDGTIEEGELAEALKTLGFTWLQDKQVKGILQRADSDANGAIDFEEFKAEAPKTLKTNLTKLAKKNGGELGFLA